MRGSNSFGRWIVAGIAVATIGAPGIARAQSVPQSLVYAVYDSETGAKDAFNAMKETQRQGVIHIDSFAVVSKDAKGHVRVQSTQKRGALAGSIIGALVGVIGGPAGVALGAGAGGGIGFLTGNAVGIPLEDINAIKASLQPGTSAIIAVVDERWVADLERSMNEAKAKQVLDHKIAGNPQQAPMDTGTKMPSTAPEGTTPPNTP
jgi:uncharacterized membrane protein